ncbi:RimK-like protein [Bradyrhizobium viridifuturi]|nr:MULTISPECIES: thioredoxin reductase [Bradyrhizobium]ERF80820.1 MAG: thioredoxin reductase (NADPH) [Bradyrhizobium sp. DFCI-1]OYU61972.1 MAG: RimK-like protein [Bradyrhizobium sp. PARBB1]PSO23069.1 RimK-like protein [Bradyrhizobium sp. MOS004]QRI70183.1 RimK-like protein [Bradyrhizobium sp. PSBB068]MBR1023511.1 RimK-like protein [Bradyrhizobium viridifuturi]
MVLISQRIFLETIKKYCLARSIAVEVRSGGWLVIMTKGRRRRLAIGYDIGLNSAVAHQVANDKSACAEVLASAGVPAIAHTLFLGGRLSKHIPGSDSLEAMRLLLDQHPRGLVVKPNEGTSGELVFRVTTRAQLEAAVARILAAHPSLAISPYVEIEHEVRVVLLDAHALIVYGKTRPMVVGDGIHSLRALAQASATAEQLKTLPEDFDAAALDAIPPAGERLLLNWRHNLDAGAEPMLIADDATRDACTALAIKAAQAVGIRFASIDVVRADGAWKVLEVNSGVKMEALGRRHPALVEAAYHAALDAVFEQVGRPGESRDDG